MHTVDDDPVQIPRAAADLIVKYGKVDIIDWDEQTELIGYPVLPVVKQLVAYVNNVESGLGEYALW